MKKLVIINLILALVLPVFAQNLEGKDRNYVEDLSAAYDAFETRKDLESAEVLNSITNKISKGYLTSSDDSVFNRYDAWNKLLIDYERFWTENSPYEFEIGALYQSGINYKNRTFNYSAEVKCQYSEKYKMMAAAVTEGFKKVYDKDWEIDGNWPTVSAVNKIADKDLYNGIALITYKNVKYPAALLDYKKSQKFFDISFNVVDLDGNILFKSGRKLVGSQGAVEFKDISLELKQKIDARLVRIIPTGLYLEYGKCDTISNTNRVWVKNLPELSMDLTKVVIRTGYDEDAATIEIAKELLKSVTDQGTEVTATEQPQVNEQTEVIEGTDIVVTKEDEIVISEDVVKEQENIQKNNETEEEIIIPEEVEENDEPVLLLEEAKENSSEIPAVDSHQKETIPKSKETAEPKETLEEKASVEDAESIEKEDKEPVDKLFTGEKKNNDNLEKSSEGKVLNIWIWEGNSFERDLQEKYINLIDPSINVNFYELSFDDVKDSSAAIEKFIDDMFSEQDSKLPDEKIDMFICESDIIHKYLGDKYTLDLVGELGFSPDELATVYPFTRDYVTNENGKQKGVCFSAFPTVFLYKKSVAKEVFGTDNPSEIQEKLKNWKSFNESAEILKNKGYKIAADYQSLIRMYSDKKTLPFVDNGKIQIDESMNQWIKDTKNFIDNGYMNNNVCFDLEIIDGMSSSGNVFGMFCADWFIKGLPYLLNDGEDDLEICMGPDSTDEGSCYICGVSGSDNKETIRKIFKGILENEIPMSLEGSVENEYFKKSAERISVKNNTEYDFKFNTLLLENMEPYFANEITLEEAWDNWYGDVLRIYPELQK